MGADTECIDLYSLNYKGCLSCFYCKRKDKEHGTCIIKDDLAPVLEKVKAADAVLFGSPIYFMNITSGMQAFLERLLFSLPPPPAGKSPLYWGKNCLPPSCIP